MNFDQFNEKSKLLINEAQNKAISLNHQQILPLHLLYSILDDKNDLIFENRYKLYKINNYENIFSTINKFDNKKILDRFLESDFMKYIEDKSNENFKILIKLK